MSPFAANSLIDAALRTTVPEDRVTDILAWCLAHNSDARQALCGVIGAPALDRSWIRTQRRVTAWDRIDCELRMTSDTDLHVVWIEVKIGRASEQPSQLQRYAEQLRSLYPGQSTLVALAPVNHDILQSALEPLVVGGVLTAEPKAIPLTWTELGVANAIDLESGSECDASAAAFSPEQQPLELRLPRGVARRPERDRPPPHRGWCGSGSLGRT